MKFIYLRGNLINLANVNHILMICPGHKDWLDTRSITADSYQIRIFFGEDDYLPISYGKQEFQWQRDWDELVERSMSKSHEDLGEPDGEGDG